MFVGLITTFIVLLILCSHVMRLLRGICARRLCCRCCSRRGPRPVENVQAAQTPLLAEPEDDTPETSADPFGTLEIALRNLRHREAAVQRREAAQHAAEAVQLQREQERSRPRPEPVLPAPSAPSAPPIWSEYASRPAWDMPAQQLCPVHSRPLVLRVNRYDQSTFFGCPEFPRCRITFPHDAPQPVQGLPVVAPQARPPERPSQPAPEPEPPRATRALTSRGTQTQLHYARKRTTPRMVDTPSAALQPSVGTPADYALSAPDSQTRVRHMTTSPPITHDAGQFRMHRMRAEVGWTPEPRY